MERRSFSCICLIVLLLWQSVSNANLVETNRVSIQALYPKGMTGQCLKMSGGSVVWGSCGSGSGGNGGTLGSLASGDIYSRIANGTGYYTTLFINAGLIFNGSIFNADLAEAKADGRVMRTFSTAGDNGFSFSIANVVNGSTLRGTINSSAFQPQSANLDRLALNNGAALNKVMHQITFTNDNGASITPTVINGTVSAARVSFDSSLLTGFNGSLNVTKLFASGQTQGDLLYFTGTNWTRLAKGADTTLLASNGATGQPYWATASGSGATNIDGLSDAKSNTLQNVVFLGNGSGLNSNGTTLRNTAVGIRTLNASNFTGDDNVVVGMNGLVALTSGSRNVAIGSSALRANTTGSDNIAIGFRATPILSSASQVIAIGSNAGPNVSNTTDVILIGHQAGNGNVNSIGIGTRSLRNVTGGTNTCVGYESCRYFTTGISNIALGYQAGTGAAGVATNMNNGVYLGYGTGTSITTADNNILLGYQAGNAITTGSSNIVIGYDIDPPSNTAIGQLTIGNLIYGNGTTATGTTVSSGKVGIRKAQPAFTLDVNGTAFSKALAVNGTALSLSQGAVLYSQNPGVVNTLAKGTNHNCLKVNGNTLAYEACSSGGGTGDVIGPGSSVINGIALFSATTGKAIKYIGSVNLLTRSQQSLYIGNGSSAYIANGTTLRNTALGYNALRGGSSFTSDDNVAVGASSLTALTSGAENTAVGSNALTAATTALQNTAVGFNSLKSTTTAGSFNTAVGHNSLQAVTGGQYNSGVGYGALFSNTSGTTNTGLGVSSLYYNVTGSGNTGVGYFAGEGFPGSSQSNGTYLGYNTGVALGVGSNNTLIGYSAGSGVINGFGNIIIGYNAGGITNSSNNIIIGRNISAYSASVNGLLAIGNLIYGNGLAATSTTVSGGKVGINQPRPTATLDINGSLAINKTITAMTSNGSVTINKAIGTANFKPGTFTLKVTNSLVTTNSVILITQGSKDANIGAITATALTGAFNLDTLSAPLTTTRVNWMVVN